MAIWSGNLILKPNAYTDAVYHHLLMLYSILFRLETQIYIKLKFSVSTCYYYRGFLRNVNKLINFFVNLH